MYIAFFFFFLTSFWVKMDIWVASTTWLLRIMLQ
jgi:hypothetical protein